jgi:hypothetical protein
LPPPPPVPLSLADLRRCGNAFSWALAAR